MLEIRNLTAGYGPILAVRGIDIDVNDGAIVALLGPNGAGKSTTLNAVMGVVRQKSGTIRLDGEMIIGKKPESIVRSGMAFVPEGRRIFGRLTVEENLLLGGASTGRGSGEGGTLLPRLVTLFPVLEKRMKTVAGSLSGGEQQQLALARAMMARPRVLLLDEPTLGLAPKLVRAIFDLIRRLRDEEGVSILVVEQNVHQALKACDMAYVMNGGRVVVAGPPSDIAGASELERAYLGLAN